MIKKKPHDTKSKNPAINNQTILEIPVKSQMGFFNLY